MFRCLPVSDLLVKLSRVVPDASSRIVEDKSEGVFVKG